MNRIVAPFLAVLVLPATSALADTRTAPDPRAARCVQEASKQVPGNDSIATAKREAAIRACMVRT